jgi:hypothetical protein
MLEDPIAGLYWNHLFTVFQAYQIIVCNAQDIPIAAGHTIPLLWDGTLQGLPRGWDAALTQGVSDCQQQYAPNTLCALAAIIEPNAQGQGLSASIIRAMKAVAHQHHLSNLIAPVRPSQKSRYPLLSIEDYVAWVRDDGLPIDPWLRVHVRLGAKLLQIAHESMRIEGSIEDWEEWGGLPLHTSGKYIIPGALVPVEIDREHDLGIYIEPNVWLCHAVDPSVG